ncbi:MAG: hypothetical protein K0U47_09205 [Epsilonproteobacteria bacterium]|nr:hypothetical protein [Campylobacterota bacterium]
MLAIPLNSSSSTQISELYGNAPFFALLDLTTGYFKVVENDELGNGNKIASFLKTKGVTDTLFYHMGEGVYKAFSEASMNVYKAYNDIMSLDEIYRKFKSGEVTLVDSKNCDDLLDPGETDTCKCGCN